MQNWVGFATVLRLYLHRQNYYTWRSLKEKRRGSIGQQKSLVSVGFLF